MALSTQVQTKPLMIAHAGGGIDGINYSNSLEALDKNYTKGFRYFEIDFSWTSDKQLVCLHDWGKRFKKMFGYKTKRPLSLSEFKKQLEDTDKLHPCTLDSFASWVIKHPDAKIITDVKYDNLDAIKLISEKYPTIKNQLIPQFYQPNEYQVLKGMGFDDLIWILYQYRGSLKSVVKLVKNMELMAVSIRSHQAKTKSMQKLKKNDVNLFVYTINKEKKLNKLVKTYLVSGIYTDFLSPN